MQENVFLGGTVYPNVASTAYDGCEFSFGRQLVLALSRLDYDRAQCALFCELFRNFTADVGHLRISLCDGESGTAVLASRPQPLPKKSPLIDDYQIQIDAQRAVLRFDSASSFAHAFCTLLSLLEVRSVQRHNECFTLPCGTLSDSPVCKMRAIHLCVFAESNFSSIRKKVREFGFLKYSHLVIEFWGTFPYACQKELGRKDRTFSRSQIKTLVAEANALGMEVIPMLNIWGHAAMHRGGYGKHVALDQNPRLQPYFNKTGWVWNLLNPQVKHLQKRMIKELIAACGNGTYFHIGCDEASAYGEERSFCGIDRTKTICCHINDMADFLKTQGRVPLMWADMLLCNPDWKGIEQNGESKESVSYLASHLSKDIVAVDWQYGVTTEEVPSAAYLAEKGFDVMLATWTNETAQKICCDNVLRHRYLGLMQTTWDSLSQNMIFAARGAICAWSGPQIGFAEPQRRMHAVLAECSRKLLPSHGNYEASGIRPKELD